MRAIPLLVILLAASQLTACVVRGDAYGRRTYPPVDTSYRTQYPANYPSNSDPYFNQSHNQSYNQNYSTPSSNYTPDQYQSNQNYGNSYKQGDYAEYAQILSVRPITSTRSSSNGGGALLGAIIGGVIGNQLARSDDSPRHSNRDYGRSPYRGDYRRGRDDNNGGRAVATVGGAIIGGLIGNEVSRSDEVVSDRTEITLRLRSGEVKTIAVASPVHLRSGDQVRVQYQNGRMTILP